MGGRGRERRDNPAIPSRVRRAPSRETWPRMRASCGIGGGRRGGRVRPSRWVASMGSNREVRADQVREAVAEGTGRLDGWSSEAASLASTHPRWPRSRASARCRCEQVRRRRPWQRRWPPLAWHGRRLRYRPSLRGRRADPGGDVLGRGEVDGDPLKDVPVAWGGRHTRVIFQDAPHHESASGCPQGDPPERPHSKEGGYRFFRRVDGRRSAAEKWGICVPGG